MYAGLASYDTILLMTSILMFGLPAVHTYTQGEYPSYRFLCMKIHIYTGQSSPGSYRCGCHSGDGIVSFTFIWVFIHENLWLGHSPIRIRVTQSLFLSCLSVHYSGSLSGWNDRSNGQRVSYNVCDCREVCGGVPTSQGIVKRSVHSRKFEAIFKRKF